MLITLYGINNIGKTTQAKKLVEKLVGLGKRAKYIKYPVYDMEPTGRFLNDFLRNGEAQKISEEELQMWFTLNRFQFQPTLKKWLEEGYIVVAEDYIGTGLAWGRAKGASLEWLESLNKFLIREDLAILMDGKRFVDAVEDGHLHENRDDLIEKCRLINLDLAEKYGWKKVNVVQGVEETGNKLWDAVKDCISGQTC